MTPMVWHQLQLQGQQGWARTDSVVKSGGMAVVMPSLGCGNVRHVGNALDLRRGYEASVSPEPSE